MTPRDPLLTGLALGRLALARPALARLVLAGLALAGLIVLSSLASGSAVAGVAPPPPLALSSPASAPSDAAAAPSMPMAIALSGPPPAAGIPHLEMTAEPAVARFMKGLAAIDPSRLRDAMRLAGLRDPGPPIRVLLVTETSGAARAAPSWAAAYAVGRAGTIVLIPTRTPSYPDGSLESVLVHEVSHVLTARAAGGHSVPRWFDEGLAMTASRERDLGDRARLILELLPGGSVRLADLDPLFGEGYGRAARAYALSGAFVGDLAVSAGRDAPGRILRLVAEGRPFEESFARATGTTLAQAEASFWRTQNIWNRWVPILTSSFTLWTGITLLAVWAIRKRRRRDARIREMWKAEEAVFEDEGPPDRYSIN